MTSPSPLNRGAPHGFALIVSLAMMTLIVLVVVATSLIVKVDTEGSAQNRSLAEARLNAITGLNHALGDLQTYAGPDQRTSASGDIVNGSADQPHWTGIWNTDPDPTGSTDFEKGIAPVWLVSSTSDPNPVAGPASANTIELVRSTSGGSESVEVEKISLSGNANETKGEFAYWVGDEGRKVNITATEPEAYESFNSSTADQLLRLSAAHHAAWEGYAGASRKVTPAEAARLETLETLPLLSDFSLGSHLHDFTTHSVALLTDTHEGGLKKDLTRILSSGFSGDATYASTAPLLPGAPSPMNTPTWGLLRSFHQLGEDLGTRGALAASVTVRPQSATQHGVYPLIGMLQMNWHARWVPTGDGSPPTQVTFAAQPMLTLVNPYNVSLQAASYTIRVGYSPGVRLQLGRGATTAPTEIVDISVSDQFNTISPHTGLMLLRTSSVPFAPGEAKIFSLPIGSGNIHYTPDAVGNQIVMLAPGLNPLDAMTFGGQHAFSTPSGQAPWLRLVTGKVLIQLYHGGTQVHYVDDIYYSSVHLGNVNLTPPITSFIPNRMILRSSARMMVAHGGTPHRADLQSGARWLANYNPRVRISRRDPAGAWISNPLFQGLWNNATEPDSYTVAADGVNAYWGADSNGGDTHNVLFDIPRQPIISLGSLQHANLSPETWYPAYAMGNSWASPYFGHNAKDFSYLLNEAFWDRYFFSALPDGLSSWPDRNDWHNTRLFPIRSLSTSGGGGASFSAYDQIGAYLGVRGGFNINSTSVVAWSALLQSLQGLDVPVADAVTGAASTAASGSNTPFRRTTLATGPAGDLWRGYRLLTPAQLERLATEIVTVIRERGPFYSLADFINRDLSAGMNDVYNLSGPLQIAIDRSGINTSGPGAPWNSDPAVPAEENRVQEGDLAAVNLTYPEASTGPRSAAAPGFLTQADLLTPLGPVLSARSDTFRIRAYGNTLNRASSKVEAEAWCEAIVQRTPDYVNPTETPDATPALAENVRFGRKFRIISFRWLTRDEL